MLKQSLLILTAITLSACASDKRPSAAEATSSAAQNLVAAKGCPDLNDEFTMLGGAGESLRILTSKSEAGDAKTLYRINDLNYFENGVSYDEASGNLKSFHLSCDEKSITLSYVVSGQTADSVDNQGELKITVAGVDQLKVEGTGEIAKNGDYLSSNKQTNAAN